MKLFPKNALGWSSIVLSCFLICLFAYCLFWILPMLTQTPGFIEQRVKEDKTLNIQYVATLEYESFAIRTYGIQIALGFLIGIMLSVFGLILFAIGASDAFEGAGNLDKSKMSIKSTSPGLIVIVASAVVVSFTVNKSVNRTFQASYEQGKQEIETKVKPLPSSRTGSDIKAKD